eukprot:1667269-Prorocentrum_lima.AAC.1
MTSSLVGSEMCIRDRTRKARLATQTLTIKNNNATPQRDIGIEIDTTMETCLLYTSDAADDM